MPFAFTSSAPRAIPGPWRVSFRYHAGIAAEPPPARTLETLADWTTIEDLRHFSGTGVYETSFDWAGSVPAASTPAPAVRLSLGTVPTGLARVFVNGTDCGVAWCAPWEVDVTAAVKPGRNWLRIEYVNNWHNRLVGDCALPPEKRVTRSCLRYWNVPRKGTNRWDTRPTVYSGPSSFDPLQPSGLLGPVTTLVLP